MDEILLSPVKLSELEALIENSVRKVFDEKPTRSVSNSEHDADLLNIKQASDFLGLSVSTIYTKVSDRIIPHSKQGKKLFFSKKELTAWVKSGQRKTVTDLQTEADRFIRSKKVA